MTTCDEIHKIIQDSEKEKLRLEFKKSTVLRESESQRNLGYEIIALANRYGGRLLLGINDDGTFEGKDLFDVDKDKGIVDNICHSTISPPIDYHVQFVNCDAGDVLILNISKRTGIPHAYIVSRLGPEIKNRIYYIRTAYGKRLVGDSQLEWLFSHQKDPDFVYDFRIVINYDRRNLNFPSSLQFPDIKAPAYEFEYLNFLQHVPEEKIKELDRSALSDLFSEITPYVLICSLSKYLGRHWLLRIERKSLFTSSLPLDLSKPKKKITVDNIPLPQPDSVASSIYPDFKSILKDGYHDFCLPVGAELKIDKVEGLQITHPNFNLSVSSGGRTCCLGPEPSSPYWPLLIGEEVPHSKTLESQPLDHATIQCTLKASFDFPEEDVQEFKDHLQFANTIKDQLLNDWDYDRFREKLSDPKLYTLSVKLDEIIAGMNRPSLLARVKKQIKGLTKLSV